MQRGRREGLSFPVAADAPGRAHDAKDMGSPFSNGDADLFLRACGRSKSTGGLRAATALSGSSAWLRWLSEHANVENRLPE
jgi:hypothetical protein